ncbi:TonB-dependent receptor [Polaribacter sp.]|uniref:TonB-dependent receptor n=1 Tax=Polaribacter sp. TaxID=1920175 RepID=UPI003F6C5F24
MKNFKNLLLVALLFVSATVLGQTKITGTVVDETNQPMPGASVLEKGTKNGTDTDFNGKFTLKASANSGTLVISYIGYKTKEVAFSSSSVGTIKLELGNSLDEIVITSGVIDIAKERETPIAVSTITPQEISLKVGNQEFPEIMNNTPGVYATKTSGGYGDSRISLRGFDQSNTSFLINGQPVNDMENGWVYWSNWQGLTDVASGIQIQRGLGASRLAVPSVGGTVSIFTKAAQKTQGGSFFQMVGNDGYLKTGASYNTGTNDKGWAFSVLLSRWEGDGYVNNTSGEGYTYFAAVGYEPEGSKSKFNLSFLGAGQWHHQRDVWVSIRDYQNFGESGIDRRWNSNGGTLNGEEYNLRRNFYNKPLATFNWDWEISENLELNTSLYGSWGRGGGTGPRGNNFRNATLDILPFNRDLTEHYNENGRGARNADGTINFDALVAENRASTSPYTGSVGDYAGQLIGSNGFRDDNVNREVLVRRASMNSHDWYGGISSLDATFGKWNASIGVDLRSYRGYHYRVLNDLLGLDGYFATGDENSAGQIINHTVAASPFNDTGLKTVKMDYYNVGVVGWQGVNGLVEYNDEEKITAVLQFGVSNQSFQREDYFNQPGNNPISDTKNMTGGYVKGGANYNFNEKSNVFFNAGFISRQPLFDAVFPNFGNAVSDDLQNEQIVSFELGYGYKTSKLDVKINAYATTWGNRFLARSFPIPNSSNFGTAQFTDIDVQHNGIEGEATYFATDKLKIRGMFSLGDWRYTKDFESSLFDDNQTLVGTGTLYLEDVKVGDAAQTTASLGVDYNLNDKISFDANYRFVDGLYADYSIEDFDTEDNDGALKLPSYGLVDLGATARFTILGMDSSFRVNVNNVFDTVYIAESNTNIATDANSVTWEGIDVRNSVWFGFGTTWNAALRFNF